jgi:hypothetical protein
MNNIGWIVASQLLTDFILHCFFWLLVWQSVNNLLKRIYSLLLIDGQKEDRDYH